MSKSQYRPPTTLEFLKVSEFKEKLDEALEAIPDELYERCRMSFRQFTDNNPMSHFSNNWVSFKPLSLARLGRQLAGTPIMLQTTKRMRMGLVASASLRHARSILSPVALDKVASVEFEQNRGPFLVSLIPECLAKYNLSPDDVWKKIRGSYHCVARIETKRFVIIPTVTTENFESIKKFAVHGIQNLTEIKPTNDGRLLLFPCYVEDTLRYDQLFDHDETETMSFRDLVSTFAIPKLSDLICENCGEVRIEDCHDLVYFLGERLREIADSLGVDYDKNSVRFLKRQKLSLK